MKQTALPMPYMLDEMPTEEIKNNRLNVLSG